MILVTGFVEFRNLVTSPEKLYLSYLQFGNLPEKVTFKVVLLPGEISQNSKLLPSSADIKVTPINEIDPLGQTCVV